MALTVFQRSLCRLIAANRTENGESYVAGGVALNAVTGGARISRDVDLFHDTQEALEATWRNDRELIARDGYQLDVIRERPSFIEARISKGGGSVLMQWVRDSAFRFFPLVRHEEFGVILHPFDLATNKVLAAVGRLEVRDWVDLIGCHESIQPLGFLAWAACGKDPGFSPSMILAQAARSSHYSATEVAELAFDGPPPDAGVLSRAWHRMLTEAEALVAELPCAEVGKCVLNADGTLFPGDPAALRTALANGAVHFHPGRIRGALPQLVL